MEIKSENKNELFKRQEFVFDNDNSISFDDARKKIAEKLDKDEEVIDVYNVKGGFGRNDFKVFANVYESKENLNIMKKLQMSKKQRDQNEKNVEEKSEDSGETINSQQEETSKSITSKEPSSEGVEENKLEESPNNVEKSE